LQRALPRLIAALALSAADVAARLQRVFHL
jgi:hypothetical protein